MWSLLPSDFSVLVCSTSPAILALLPPDVACHYPSTGAEIALYTPRAINSCEDCLQLMLSIGSKLEPSLLCFQDAKPLKVATSRHKACHGIEKGPYCGVKGESEVT